MKAGAAVKTVKSSSGWTAELTVPLKNLNITAKEVPVNFARQRALNGKPVKELYYQWSPLPADRMGGFHAIENWGRMIFGQPPKSLVYNGDMSKLTIGNVPDGWAQHCWKSAGAKGGQVVEADKKIFISGGASLHYKNVLKQRICAGCKLPEMKPNTKYLLSYYVRSKGVQKGTGTGAFIYFSKKTGRPFPYTKMTGDNPWHRLNFEFKTPADTGKDRIPQLELWIWTSEGEVWFDNVELKEIK